MTPTATSITGLFAMLLKPITDAFAAERAVWRASSARRLAERTAADASNVAYVDGLYAAADAIKRAKAVVPAPVVEIAVVVATVAEMPVPAAVAVAALEAKPARRKAASPRAKKALVLVMAGAARQTRTPRTKAVAAVAPERVKAFTAHLPATKTCGDWSIKFEPVDSQVIAGKLCISSKRSGAIYYTVTEFPTGWEGRGFHLAKVAGGTDCEAEGYHVFCGRAGAETDSCDCKGSTRWGGCKHKEAVRTLILNDVL